MCVLPGNGGHLVASDLGLEQLLTLVKIFPLQYSALEMMLRMSCVSVLMAFHPKVTLGL